MVKGQTSRRERGVHELCIYNESERSSSVQAHCGKTVLKQSTTLPGYGPVTLMKRPVRIRMQGVVGAGGEKPPATRLADFLITVTSLRYPQVFLKMVENSGETDCTCKSR